MMNHSRSPRSKSWKQGSQRKQPLRGKVPCSSLFLWNHELTELLLFTKPSGSFSDEEEVIALLQIAYENEEKRASQIKSLLDQYSTMRNESLLEVTELYSSLLEKLSNVDLVLFPFPSLPSFP